MHNFLVIILEEIRSFALAIIVYNKSVFMQLIDVSELLSQGAAIDNNYK